MLSNPRNVVCLTFEAELVSKYFRRTHKFHSFVSENCPGKPGLDLLGVSNFLVNFIVPFWQQALEDPGKVFSETVEAINALDDEEDRKKKMEQLEAAIEAANEKLAKLYERWLKAPLCFLLLSNPVHGPPLLRVILKIMRDKEFDLEDKEDRYMEGEEYEQKYGISHDASLAFRFSPSTIEDMPSDERAWYELLIDGGTDDVYHYFQQFGFGRSILRTELKKLSQEVHDNSDEQENSRRADSDTPLRDFFNLYPIIYDCLQAALARIPSNSRLSEMGHSFTRNMDTSQTPMSRVELILKHLVNTGFVDRKERRQMCKSKSLHKKHLDTKEKQIKSGEQVKVRGEKRYSFEAMDRLPEEVKKAKRIKVLRDEGVMRLEEARNKGIIEHYEGVKASKRRRRKLATLDMDEIQERARAMESEHDLKWHTREYTKELQMHAEFMKKAYWNAITGQLKDQEDKSNLHKEIRLVLPFFHSEDVADATASALKSSKSDDSINLSKHLKTIEAIVKLKAKNTLSDHNDEQLEAMSELQRYKLFMNVDASPRAASVREQIENKRKRTKSVLGLFGAVPMYGVDSTEDGENGDDSDDEDSEDAINAYLDS